MHLCYVYDPALVAFSDNQVTPTLDERPDMILSIKARPRLASVTAYWKNAAKTPRSRSSSPATACVKAACR